MLCPPGATALTNFTDAAGAAWLACEDFDADRRSPYLGRRAVHLQKTQAIYAAARRRLLPRPRQAYGARCGPHRDVSARRSSRNHCRRTHVLLVERRRAPVPPIRKSGQGGHSDNWEACQGVRSFVGSRSSSNDATFSDFGEDCSTMAFRRRSAHWRRATRSSTGRRSTRARARSPTGRNTSTHRGRRQPRRRHAADPRALFSRPQQNPYHTSAVRATGR